MAVNKGLSSPSFGKPDPALSRLMLAPHKGGIVLLARTRRGNL